MDIYFFSLLTSVARLAQSVEHGTLNPRVVGSSPTLGALFLFFLNILLNAILFSFVFIALVRIILR